MKQVQELIENAQRRGVVSRHAARLSALLAELIDFSDPALATDLYDEVALHYRDLRFDYLRSFKGINMPDVPELDLPNVPDRISEMWARHLAESFEDRDPEPPFARRVKHGRRA